MCYFFYFCPVDELKFHTKLTTKADRIGIVLEGAPSFRNVSVMFRITITNKRDDGKNFPLSGTALLFSRSRVNSEYHLFLFLVIYQRRPISCLVKVLK